MSAADALQELAGAREELRAASHTIALVKIGADDDGPAAPGLTVRRREIELRVAELRLSEWSHEVRRLENAVRRFGLRP